MTLTLRFDEDQEKLIHKLKVIYDVGTASNAILKAIQYIANQYENDKIKIAGLKTEVFSLKNKINEVKSCLKDTKQIFLRLEDFSKTGNI